MSTGKSPSKKVSTNTALRHVDDKLAERQFSLFELLDTDDRLSNTIELYDALPKYSWNVKHQTDLQEAEITRSCRIRGRDYTVTIRPAIIKKDKKNKKSVLIYPGTREEVIEDALRKFATAGQGQMVQQNAVVMFTLTQLQNELKSMGHSYSLDEIKQALAVCQGAVIECSTNEGETVISSTFFPAVGLSTRSDYVNNARSGKDTRCFVQFNPLVSKSIIELTFRQYDYRLGMELTSPLARYIYKRMSHHWIQASPSHPYTPNLVSFLSQSPRGLSADMYTNTRAMNNALDILVKRKVIKKYEAFPVKQLHGKKIKDVRYQIWPHDEFIASSKKANWHAKNIEERASQLDALAVAKGRQRIGRQDQLPEDDEFNGEAIIEMEPVEKPAAKRASTAKKSASKTAKAVKTAKAAKTTRASKAADKS